MGLPANNKFASKGAAAKPAAAKTKPKASRYGAFAKREEGPPMLECMRDKSKATYRVRFESAEEVISPRPDGNDSIKTYLEVLDAEEGAPTAVGSRVLALNMQTTYGRQDFNEMVVALAGYDADDENDLAAYMAFDPDGQFFAAAVGDSNAYATEAAALVGRVVDVQVGYKKDDGKGGYYRTYNWAPVPDDDADQDVSPKIERA